jgi:glycosyltransferase involved in cell wall biosynthesis
VTGGDLRATVVVPVLDLDLRALVAALRVQTIGVDRFEVIVADDGSTAPLGISPEEGWLRIETAPHANSYAARNRGARLAGADVLAFCDGDCRPEPDWLERGLAALDRGAELAAGDVWPDAPPRLTPWALLDADEALNQGRAVAEQHVVTANLFVRRDAFERLGGFDEGLPSGGDYEFAERAVGAGERLVLADDAVVRHPTVYAAAPYLRRAWFRDRSLAVRRASDGRLALLANIPKLLPVVGPVWARWRLGRPLGLDSARLRWQGGVPARRTVAAALALRYLVLPYVTAAAYIPFLPIARYARSRSAT